ncbi:CDP-glucose 4,6-dehydratase [Rhodospirillaceae bacterium KN72]|uniref:CDP-glucose 4,6-dehydratase n=1 Tax=Pacificispira spongiicola TaxID=2729598 RepID=A0A7Y0DWI5_9PROT|nr:CDP-glucose 4,6-dehydratase [Pacificispira spongiicola]NMM42902.1 CDP-glucose 4,6-dehydratase [Pacificispira spongiicola]
MTGAFSIYDGLPVAVTGHTGFKGGWLTLMLRHFGARISGFSLPCGSKDALYERAGIRDSVAAETLADINEPGRVADWLTETQPAILFHLAAQPLVRASYNDPAETYETNVMGLVRLLEAARRVESLRAIVVVTTDKCYRNTEQIWGYREDDPLGGDDPYSASKACAEIVSQSYAKSFFHRDASCLLATARAGNVIGGGDWSVDRLVPDAIRALLNGEPLVLRNPGAIRPWQHVLEPLTGYLEVGRRLLNGDSAAATAWNFGPYADDQVPVSDLARGIVDCWGSGRIETAVDPKAVKEAALLKLDIAKASSYLDFKPRYRVDRAIAETIEWYRGVFVEKKNAHTLTMEQIERYLAAAPSP